MSSPIEVFSILGTVLVSVTSTVIALAQWRTGARRSRVDELEARLTACEEDRRELHRQIADLKDDIARMQSQLIAALANRYPHFGRPDDAAE